MHGDRVPKNPFLDKRCLSGTPGVLFLGIPYVMDSTVLTGVAVGLTKMGLEECQDLSAAMGRLKVAGIVAYHPPVLRHALDGIDFL